MNKVQVDWEDAQKFLNETGSIKETINKFHISRSTFRRAVIRGDIVKNLKQYKHTKETKELLSKQRVKFLKDNPDKHPWKRNDKFKSFPCEYLKDFLRNNNIDFEEEFNDFDRHYSIDIAFPQSKIALEVNGNQHYKADGSLTDYFQEREDYLTNLGWNVKQIPCGLVFKDSFKSDLLRFIKDNVDFDLKYIPRCKRVNKKPTKELIENTKNVFRLYSLVHSNIDFSRHGAFTKLGKLLGLTPQYTARWIKEYFPNFLKWVASSNLARDAK